MPAAWERTSERWSCSRRAGGIGTVASEPKPVVTPYTGSAASACRAVTAALRSIAPRAAAASETWTSLRATAITSSGRRSGPTSITG